MILHIIAFQKRLLLDPDNPTKYASVLVDREGYRQMLAKAKKTKKQPGSVLQQAAIDLVFTKQELADSAGLRLRKESSNEKEKDHGRSPLDNVRVQAVMGMLHVSSSGGASL